MNEPNPLVLNKCIKRIKMKKEDLENGKRLDEQITKLSAQLEIWRNSTEFRGGTVEIFSVIEGKKGIYHVQSDHIDFNVVRAVTVAKLEKDLAELQRKFDELGK